MSLPGDPVPILPYFKDYTMRQNFFSPVVLLALAIVSCPVFAAGAHGDEHVRAAERNIVGGPGQAAQVARTVTVDMTDDMRFNPSQITVKRGETIRFVVKNSGKIKHEMVLGTTEELKKHYDMMMKMPGMEHAEANQVAVDPGKQGELIWRFTRAGKVDFACLQPGHYDAGMKGLVTVAGGKSAKADTKR